MNLVVDQCLHQLLRMGRALREDVRRNVNFVDASSYLFAILERLLVDAHSRQEQEDVTSKLCVLLQHKLPQLFVVRTTRTLRAISEPRRTRRSW